MFANGVAVVSIAQHSTDLYLLSFIKLSSIYAEKNYLEVDWSIKVSMVTHKFWESENITFASLHQKTYSY